MSKIELLQNSFSSEQKRLLLHPSVEVSPCLWVVPAQKNDPIHGVFGGWPSLPQGVTWPTDNKNRYFPYVARLDFDQAQQMIPQLNISGVFHLFLDEEKRAQTIIQSDALSDLVEQRVDLKRKISKSDSVVSMRIPFPQLNLTFKAGLSVIYTPQIFTLDEITVFDSFIDDRAIARIGGLTEDYYSQTAAFLTNKKFNFLASNQKYWMMNETDFDDIKKMAQVQPPSFYEFKFDLKFIYKMHIEIIEFLASNKTDLMNRAKKESKKWPSKYTSAVNNLIKICEPGYCSGINLDRGGNNPVPYVQQGQCLEELGNFIISFNNEIRKLHSEECEFIIDWLIQLPGYKGFLENDSIRIPRFKYWDKYTNSRLILDVDLFDLISHNLKFIEDFDLSNPGGKLFGIQIAAKEFKHKLRSRYCDFLNNDRRRNILTETQINEISESIDLIKSLGGDEVERQMQIYAPLITLHSTEFLSFGDQEKWMYLYDKRQDPFKGEVYASITRS